LTSAVKKQPTVKHNLGTEGGREKVKTQSVKCKVVVSLHDEFNLLATEGTEVTENIKKITTDRERGGRRERKRQTTDDR
jgi:hypothetical protein